MQLAELAFAVLRQYASQEQALLLVTKDEIESLAAFRKAGFVNACLLSESAQRTWSKGCVVCIEDIDAYARAAPSLKQSVEDGALLILFQSPGHAQGRRQALSELNRGGFMVILPSDPFSNSAPWVAEYISDRLAWIYACSEWWTLEQKYNAWSRYYDAELLEPWAPCVFTSAQKLAVLLRGMRDAPILDVGSGTGLVGDALSSLGFSNVTGCDLSSGMLEKAREKKVYSRLLRWDIEDSSECPFAQGEFQAIISTGVFTYGHAPPSALTGLLQLLRVGGLFALTVRKDFLKSSAELASVLSRAPLKEIQRHEHLIWDSEPTWILLYVRT